MGCAAVLTGASPSIGQGAVATVTPPIVSTITVRAVSFEGNHVLPSAELAKRISIIPGHPFNEAQLKFSVDVIGSIYRDQGYADIHVSTTTAVVQPLEISVRFLISEGEPYHIGQITIKGNKIIAAKMIERDLGVKTGDLFSQSKIYDGNKQLFLSGYFQKVDIQFSTAAAHIMDIHIQVSERPTRFVKGGLGYGTETKERVSLGYEDRNFLGNEKQLDLTAIHSGFLTNPPKYRTTILEISLAQPHFLATSLEAQTAISREWDDRQPYDSITSAWRSSVGRKFGHNITASLRYRFQGTEITRIDPSAASTTPGFTNVSAIGPTFTYDDTNDPFLPSNGWRVTGLAEKGFTLGIGDINFHKLEARVGRFDTLRGFTFFEAIQSGFISPDNPNDSIPIFERYTLGGANTVRGYEEEELGPKDTQGNPLGGEAFLVGNLELRHVLYKKLVGLWFLDGGQLYTEGPGFSWPYIRAKGLGDFAYGTGPGIRLNTPVGAIRLEAGYKLNPPGNGGGFFDHTAIDFSLGEVF